MLSTNPFSNLFEILGQDSANCAASVNKAAFDDLKRALLQAFEERVGKQILLKSPRAGFGKTHLLQRVASDMPDAHFIDLSLKGGQALDAATVTEEIIVHLLQPLPAGSGLTSLDLLIRRVFSAALAPLVSAGEIPCDDRETAINALTQRPIETFDFHHEQALTAHWARENFRVLGPRLSLQAARIYGTTQRDSNYWIEIFFEYATSSPELPLRNSDLINSVASDLGKGSEVIAMERLSALLAFVTGHLPVVLVVDDTEGLSSAPAEALALVSFLQGLRQHAPRASVVLSVNGDVWETGFLPRLPGGLKDRLCENQICLKPMSFGDVEEFIQAAGGEHAPAIIEELEGMDGVLYARRVSQKACQIWNDLQTEEEEQEAQTLPEGATEEPSTYPKQDKRLAVATAAALAETVASLATPRQPQKEALEPSETSSRVAPEAPQPGAPLEEPSLSQAQSIFNAFAAVDETPPSGEDTVHVPQADAAEPKYVTASEVAEPPIQEASDSGRSSAVEQPAGSPFSASPIVERSVESIQPEPMTPPVQNYEESTIQSPFRATPEPMETVTPEDHLKVDQLLRQFRERHQSDEQS